MEFIIGQGCSVSGYSDVKACTVVSISKNGKKISVQEDHATLLNGLNSSHPQKLHFEAGGFCGHTSGKQIWELKPNEKGTVHVFSLRKNGFWRKKGQSMTGTGDRLYTAHIHYYDFNF